MSAHVQFDANKLNHEASQVTETVDNCDLLSVEYQVRVIVVQSCNIILQTESAQHMPNGATTFTSLPRAQCIRFADSNRHKR